MGYELRLSETFSEGVRRIAHEQLDNALDSLEAAGSAHVEDAVHDVRKGCKKLRALVRLARPAMGEAYTTANVTFRDAARELSSIRDAHALLTTFDVLVAGHVDLLPPGGIAGVRAELSARAQAASEVVQADDPRVERAQAMLADARTQVDGWPLSDTVATLRGGAAKTYRRGRKRLSDCLSHPCDELLHQWRKRAKYSWYHIRLLHRAAPSLLEPLAARLHDLSDALGDDHDLAVLALQLRADPEAFGGEDEVDSATVVINGRRADLQRRAISLGTRLYVESASAFSDRLAGYSTVWRTHGAELAVGEMADLYGPLDDLEDCTRTELYELAQRADIPGRSQMSRNELLAAIRVTGNAALAAT